MRFSYSPDLAGSAWEPFDPFAEALPGSLISIGAPRADRGAVVAVAVAAAPTDQEWIDAACLRVADMCGRKSRGSILVDLDFAHPHLHKSIGVPNQVGIGDVLLESATLDQVTRPVAERGFRFVPAGAGIGSRSGVLENGYWGALLPELTRHGTTVVLHVPLAAAGVESMLARADAVVLLGRPTDLLAILVEGFRGPVAWLGPPTTDGAGAATDAEAVEHDAAPETSGVDWWMAETPDEGEDRTALTPVDAPAEEAPPEPEASAPVDAPAEMAAPARMPVVQVDEPSPSDPPPAAPPPAGTEAERDPDELIDSIFSDAVSGLSEAWGDESDDEALPLEAEAPPKPGSASETLGTGVHVPEDGDTRDRTTTLVGGDGVEPDRITEDAQGGDESNAGVPAPDDFDDWATDLREAIEESVHYPRSGAAPAPTPVEALDPFDASLVSEPLPEGPEVKAGPATRFDDSFIEETSDAIDAVFTESVAEPRERETAQLADVTEDLRGLPVEERPDVPFDEPADEPDVEALPVDEAPVEPSGEAAATPVDDARLEPADGVADLPVDGTPVFASADSGVAPEAYTDDLIVDAVFERIEAVGEDAGVDSPAVVDTDADLTPEQPDEPATPLTTLAAEFEGLPTVTAPLPPRRRSVPPAAIAAGILLVAVTAGTMVLSTSSDGGTPGDAEASPTAPEAIATDATPRPAAPGADPQTGDPLRALDGTPPSPSRGATDTESDGAVADSDGPSIARAATGALPAGSEDSPVGDPSAPTEAGSAPAGGDAESAGGEAATSGRTATPASAEQQRPSTEGPGPEAQEQRPTTESPDARAPLPIPEGPEEADTPARPAADARDPSTGSADPDVGPPPPGDAPSEEAVSELPEIEPTPQFTSGETPSSGPAAGSATSAGSAPRFPSEAPTPNEGPSGPMAFGVVVGSHANLAAARAQAARLRGQLADVLFAVSAVDEGSLVYRVVAGSSATRDEALGVRTALGEAGATPAAGDVRSTRWAFLLGVYEDWPEAVARVGVSESVEIPAYIVEIPVADDRVLYRVYSGAFASESEAAPTAGLIEAAGLGPPRLTERVGRQIR